jgi:hypothetical protein
MDWHQAPAGWVVLRLAGHGAQALARTEEGTHLFVARDGCSILVQVLAIPLEAGQSAEDVVRGQEVARESWLRRISEGKASADDDPAPLSQILRVYGLEGATVDLRSGLMAPSLPTAADLRAFILSALPLPPELRT